MEQLIVTDPALVEQVYSGAAGKCCCGCAGNYSSGPRNVKAHVTRMNKRAKEIDGGSGWSVYNRELPSLSSYVSFETATRVLILYVKSNADIRREGNIILVTRKEA